MTDQNHLLDEPNQLPKGNTERNWSKPTRYMVLSLMLIGVVWFVIYARDLVGSIAIGALLAFFLNPLVTVVNERIRISRTLTILLVYLITLSSLVGLGIIFAPVVPAQAANLFEQFQQISQELRADLIEIPTTALGLEIDLSSLLPEVSEIQPEDLARPDIILGAIQATTTNVGWLLVILVSSFYILKDWSRLKAWIFSWVPPGYSEDANYLYADIQVVWNGYFRGQFRLSIIVGILTGVGLAVVGMPGAVIFGIAAGVLDVLLSVGPALVMVVAGVVALFSGSNLFLDMSNILFTIIVFGVFSIVQGVENLWLRPRIMSSTVKIHPAIIFIAIIASLALAGVLTALLIIPVMGSFGVVTRYLYCRLFDIDPWLGRPNQTAVSPKNSSQTAVANSAPQPPIAQSE